MSGLFLIIVSSLLYPIADVLKKQATQSYSIKTIYWAIATFSLPFFVLLLWYQGIPRIEPVFWIIIAIDVPLLIFTQLLLIKEEKIAPLSTTLPLLSFTPVFLIATSYFLLGELPTRYGVLGVILVVAGAILLKGEELRQGLRRRLFQLFKQSESRAILLIAFIWSFSAVFAKMAMDASSPYFYIVITGIGEALYLNLWMLRRHRKDFRQIVTGHLPLLIAAALVTVVSTLLFLVGLQTTLVAYAIAIKRAGLIFVSIIAGVVWFKETNLRYRILGAAFLTAGIMCILLFR